MTSWSQWPKSVHAVSVGARGDPRPPSARTVPAEPRCSRVHRCVTPLRAADLVLATHNLDLAWIPMQGPPANRVNPDAGAAIRNC